MTKNDETILCGSCKGKPILVSRVFMGKFFYSVQCSKCGCHLGYWYSNEKSAYRAWKQAWEREEKC